MWIDNSKVTDWKIVKEMVVGGLEWIGFSKIEFSGETVLWDCDYDKELQIAYCDKLPNEERITDFIFVVFVMMESILLFPKMQEYRY